MNEISREKELFGILWGYVRQDRKNLLLLILLLLLNTALTIAAPFYFQDAIDIVENVIRNDTSGLLAPLILALIFYFVLTVLAWLANATIMVFSARLNGGVIEKLRMDSFRSMIKNKVEFFDKSDSGKLVNTLTNDLNELYDTGNAVAQVIVSMLKLVGIVVVLFSFSIPLSLATVFMLPVFFIVTLTLRRYRRRYEMRWRQRFGEVNQSFAEKMRSLAISKAFNQEKRIVREFGELNHATYLASKSRGAAIFITRPIADLIQNIMLILILAVGTWQSQSYGLSTATFYLFIFLLDFFYEPVRAVAQNYTYFQSLFTNLERILAISHFSYDKQEQYEGRVIAELKGQLDYEHVDFSYDGKNMVLKDINFSVQPGQRVAIVGHTGAGKSTIAGLQMQFYDLDAGVIRLDGYPLPGYNLHSLRENIAYVSQTILLFKGTIRDNLKLGKQNLDDDDLWRAIEMVQAREFIEQLPHGLNTLIEEGGRNLSVGQRQMLSYARAILSDPRLIILDEATSAVDLYTEAKIQQATELLLEGRTSIVIAHRLTTIVRSDVIVVLEDGEIQQIGNHQELLEQDGLYREMYDLYFQTQSAEYLETIKTN